MNIVCDVPFASGKLWGSMGCRSNAVEQWLQEERSDTSLQLCQKLATERQVHLSQRTMSRLLQKRGSVGNDYATVRLPPNSQSL